MHDGEGEDAIWRGGSGVEPCEEGFGALVGGEECSCFWGCQKLDCVWVLGFFVFLQDGSVAIITLPMP